MVTKILAILLCAVSALATYIPDKWWENIKGTEIKDQAELDELLDDNPKAYLVIEFYMQDCQYCFKFSTDWN